MAKKKSLSIAWVECVEDRVSGEGYRSFLNDQYPHLKIGFFDNYDQAIRNISRRCNCVVVNPYLSRGSEESYHSSVNFGIEVGLDLVKKLHETKPHLPIVIISHDFADNFSVFNFKKLLKSGASEIFSYYSARNNLLSDFGDVIAKYLS